MHIYINRILERNSDALGLLYGNDLRSDEEIAEHLQRRKTAYSWRLVRPLVNITTEAEAVEVYGEEWKSHLTEDEVIQDLRTKMDSHKSGK